MLAFEGQQDGVQSVLVDGFAVARDFQTKFGKEFDLLSKVKLDWKYLDKGSCHFKAIAPVIGLIFCFSVIFF